MTIKGFETSGNTQTAVTGGPDAALTGDENNVKRVKDYFEQNQKSHKEWCTLLNMSYSTIWRILRKNLKFKAYRPHLVLAL